MPKTLGTNASLIITIPSKRETQWADVPFESGFAQKIADHDHSTGKGVRIGTAGLADLAVTTGKINDLAITTGKLAANSVTTAKIVDSNVTTAKIADANVTTAKIADDAVDDTKIRLRNNQYLTARNAAGNADIDIVRVNSSDVIELAGDVAPADNSISTAKLQNLAVTEAKLATGAVTAGKLGTSAVTSVKILDSAVTTSKINDEAVTLPKLVAAAKSVTVLNYSTNTVIASDLNSSASSIIFVEGNVVLDLDNGVSALKQCLVVNVSGSSRTVSFDLNGFSLSLGSMANNTARLVFVSSNFGYALPSQTVTVSS